jgi:hypothetical protein
VNDLGTALCLGKAPPEIYIHELGKEAEFRGLLADELRAEKAMLREFFQAPLPDSHHSHFHFLGQRLGADRARVEIAMGNGCLGAPPQKREFRVAPETQGSPAIRGISANQLPELCVSRTERQWLHEGRPASNSSLRWATHEMVFSCPVGSKPGCKSRQPATAKGNETAKPSTRGQCKLARWLPDLSFDNSGRFPHG